MSTATSVSPDTVATVRLRRLTRKRRGQGKHRRMFSWDSWADSARVAVQPRFRFITALAILGALASLATTALTGYGVYRIVRAINEERAANCQDELNAQRTNPTAGVLPVCRSLTVGVKLGGQAYNRDTANPAPPPPGPAKKAMR